MDLFEVGSFDQKSMNKPVWTCSKWIPTRRRRATTTTTRTPTASIRQRTRPSEKRRFPAEMEKYINVITLGQIIYIFLYNSGRPTRG
jgi:hypothetical protein